MDEHFFQYYSQGDGDQVSWFGEFLPFPVINEHGSAFVKYARQPLHGFGSKGWTNDLGKNSTPNANKRMIEFLMKSWKTPVEAQRERNHKHMIDERMRRGDKNSVVQMATERVQELQRCKEELKNRKAELELALLAAENQDNEKNMEEAEIKLRVAHPSSGIDSMLEVLKCLKSTGTNTKAIQSTFSSQEFSAALQIEAKIGAEEVEKAVHKTLFEVEKKHGRPFFVRELRKQHLDVNVITKNTVGKKIQPTKPTPRLTKVDIL
ncbi:hypothetical protein ACH5RR_033093 [Cinchona calisaya]|uniref:Uncharacterized protein n=1 Tax=Cinchona calisaya TaxID=153742 RepID=A0ABD2YJY9_9GENT